MTESVKKKEKAEKVIPLYPPISLTQMMKQFDKKNVVSAVSPESSNSSFNAESEYQKISKEIKEVKKDIENIYGILGAIREDEEQRQTTGMPQLERDPPEADASHLNNLFVNQHTASVLTTNAMSYTIRIPIQFLYQS